MFRTYGTVCVFIYFFYKRLTPMGHELFKDVPRLWNWRFEFFL